MGETARKAPKTAIVLMLRQALASSPARLRAAGTSALPQGFFLINDDKAANGLWVAAAGLPSPCPAPR